MPSPDQEMTITEIAKELKCCRSTVSGWRDRGLIKKSGQKRTMVGKPNLCGRRHRDFKGGVLIDLFLWKDILALGYTAGSTKGGSASMAPAGYITITDAACRLGFSEGHVKSLIREGKIRGISVPYPGASLGKRRTILFAHQETIEAMAREKGIRKHIVERGASESLERPLISANNHACLEARRELWCRSGRILPKKYRISVARRQKAG